MKILVGAAAMTASMILVAPSAMAGDMFGYSGLGATTGRYDDSTDTVTACGNDYHGGYAQLKVQQADGSWAEKAPVRTGARTCYSERRDVQRENAMLKLVICQLGDWGQTQYCETKTFSGA
ncbi:hypothetical protein JNB_15028 [Janibacter sp. HTCC2649]|nr:hypothetical protein JNB_15028 [Janibacter sp. HTCC2649]